MIQENSTCRSCFNSPTVRYELRVLVGFKRAHKRSPKVYTGPAAKVCSCDLAWNYNGLSALCSFEPGIAMVEQTPRCPGAI